MLHVLAVVCFSNEGRTAIQVCNLFWSIIDIWKTPAKLRGIEQPPFDCLQNYMSWDSQQGLLAYAVQFFGSYLGRLR